LRSCIERYFDGALEPGSMMRVAEDQHFALSSISKKEDYVGEHVYFKTK